MTNHELAMALAKVLIAAAWIDGELVNDEVNSMKMLLARIPQAGTGTDGQLTANEWAELEIYLHAPVGPEERTRLVADLQAALRNPADRQTALAALEAVINADRVVTPEEQAVLVEIRAALAQVELGLLARIGRLFRGAAQVQPTPSNAPNREQFLEDFVKNRIYFSVRQRLRLAPDADLGIGDVEARKLSLAGGLLAFLAHADSEVTAAERSAMEQALQRGWGISATAAALVAEVALSEAAQNLDFYQLTQAFARSTNEEERARFLDALFLVAAADGLVSGAESSTISRIAYSINLTQEHFVAAKQRTKV